MTFNEADIIKRCQQGDLESFDILVSRYTERAYAVAFSVMGNSHDAGDMTQEAFIKVFRNISKFNFKSSFNTWLHRIVKNVCIDELRKRKRGTILSLDASISSDDGEYTLQIPDESPGIQEILEKEEEKEFLWKALEELKENHRVVLVLADIKGYDYTEVAQILDIPVGTVKSRISRARIKLAEIIRKMGTF